MDSINELLHRVTEADGVAPLSEQFLVGLDDERLGHKHFIHEEDGRPVGILALDGDTAEMAVDPGYRQRGIGRSLWERACPRAVWAHGDLPPARGFAAAVGLQVTRRLQVMEVSGAKLADAASLTVADYETLDYEQAVRRWGKDSVDNAWLKVNNEAFDWHPEQGGWDLARLRRGQEAKWFDPHDVVFFFDGETLVGFHWTKWHAEEGGFGEVYVVGLANAYRGQGLGAFLLAAGLSRLVSKGARRVILYVEADNEPAVSAYEGLGFATVEAHVVYERVA